MTTLDGRELTPTERDVLVTSLMIIYPDLRDGEIIINDDHGDIDPAAADTAVREILATVFDVDPELATIEVGEEDG